MATKKKRRSSNQTGTSSGRAAKPTATTGSGQKAASTAPGAATVKVRPAEPGGPNRQARKEEARRQREAVRKRASRRRTYRIVAAIVAVLVAIAAVVILVQHNRDKAAKAAALAGCGPVQTIKPYNATDDQAHIGAQGSKVTTPPPLSTYPSTPPVSGPHLPPGQWVPSGVKNTPPNIYGAIHSLEHGAVIIWYAPSAPAESVAELTKFYGSASENDHVIVAPYNYPDQGAQGQLPAGKNMVLVAWHHMEVCNSVGLEAAKSFVKSFRVTTGAAPSAGYKGDAPEAGASISL